jgi:hypothetical protein
MKEESVNRFKALAQMVNEKKEKQRQRDFEFAVKYQELKQEFLDQVTDLDGSDNLSAEEIINQAKALQKETKKEL